MLRPLKALLCYVVVVGQALPWTQQSIYQALHLASLPLDLSTVAFQGSRRLADMTSMRAACKKKDGSQAFMQEFNKCNQGMDDYRNMCLPGYCKIENVGEDMSAMGRLELDVCKAGKFDVAKRRKSARSDLDRTCRCLGQSMGVMAHGACCIGQIMYTNRAKIFAKIPKALATEDIIWSIIDASVFATAEKFTNWQCQRSSSSTHYCGEMVVDMMALNASSPDDVLSLDQASMAPHLCLQLDATGMCTEGMQMGPTLCKDALEKLAAKYGCCVAGYRDVLRNITLTVFEKNLKAMSGQVLSRMKQQLAFVKRQVPSSCGASLPSACKAAQEYEFPIKSLESCPAGADAPGFFDGGCQSTQPLESEISSFVESPKTYDEASASLEQQLPGRDCSDPSVAGCPGYQSKSVPTWAFALLGIVMMLALAAGAFFWKGKLGWTSLSDPSTQPPETEMRPSKFGYAPPEQQ